MDSKTDAGSMTTPFIPPQDQKICIQVIQPPALQDQSAPPAAGGNTTHPQHAPPPPPPTSPPPPPPPPPQEQQPYPASYPEEMMNPGVPGNIPGVPKRGRVVPVVFNNTLLKTSNLVNFLPTGTLLAFEMLLPSVSGNGKCNQVSTFLIGSILALCATTCCFFHFTDSIRDHDQKIYYGFVTFKGLMVFKDGGVKYIAQPDRLKAGLTDFIHAVMSAMVFVAIAFSDQRVTACLFPGHVKDMQEIMQTFPIMVGIVCSGLFLIFPNTRYGVGCMPT